jgi:hypothetical protein
MTVANIYMKQLLARRASQSATELVWELHAALAEKQARGEPLSTVEQRALACCAVSTCDGIESLLPHNIASIAATAAFAKLHGLNETSRILDDVVRDKPVAGPVSFSSNIGGAHVPLDVDAGRWGATDMTLTFIDEPLDEAILDDVAAHLNEFALATPAARAHLEAKAAAVDQAAKATTAVEMIDALLAHRNPRICAQIRDDERRNRPSDWIEVPVTHTAGKPLAAKRLASLRKQYGKAADDLLDVYAKYDGLALFATPAEAAIHILPVSEWAEHHERVIDWCTQVTWSDALDEMPPYLHTAIAFGYTPGDAERWILITEGQHAGKIMLSDTDSIEDTPRFDSIAHFVAALTQDVERTLGCGGYISYGEDREPGGDYYPEVYKHDAS